jgi:hypothetical protein
VRDFGFKQKNMRHILSILALVVMIVSGCSSTPKLPLPEQPTCLDIALTANKYIALGEENAVKELKQLCKLSKKSRFSDYVMGIQVGFICRVIFEPKEGRPIREPGFGALRLPWNTMKAEDWPLYPVAESEGIYFILSQSYYIRGLPEDPQHYIDYYRSRGVFRKAPVKIPTGETAWHALAGLLSSCAWKKIKWKDSGDWFSYEMSKETVIEYLEAQTKIEPDQQPAPEQKND